MAAIEPIVPPDDPPDPPPPLPGDGPGSSSSGGLGGYTRRRYTSNLVINEQVSVIDLFYDVLFPASRMFLAQGANGKIRLHNKKPVDFGLGLTEFTSGDTAIEIDDVSPWIANPDNYILIGPHTNKSEVRTIVSVAYSTDQNSVTLTTDSPSDIDITGFSGCDGASTPATATVQILSFTASTDYTVTLDGFDITFTPTAGDSVTTIASFLSAAFKGHPALKRKFLIEFDDVDTVTLTGLFGDLTVAALTNTHIAPVADPLTAPTLTATASGVLAAGDYRVAYTFSNEQGQTLLSPYKSVTLSASQKISVTAITPPAGCTVMWYVSCEAGSTKIRFHAENDGSAFIINSTPLLTAPLPPDLNRTGTEVMRIMAAFSDRAEIRSEVTASNVIRATFKWSLGNREKSINRIDLKWRDSGQDWRLIESRFRDDANIAKIKKINNYEINGQAIDNLFQAYRIGAAELAERRDADFFYSWSSTRIALLLEEGDVVAITDDGSGVFNFPVKIEAMEIDTSKASLPTVSFTARKYSNTLYDDSVVERTIPVVTERGSFVTFGGDSVMFSGDSVMFGS